MNTKHLIIAALAIFSLNGWSQKELTNELIWASSTFSSERFEQGPSMNDGLHYTLQKTNKALGDYIVKYAYANGDSVGVIASSKSIFNDVTKGFDGYSFSADESKLMIETNNKPLYRHSYYSTYYIHDLKTQKTQLLLENDQEQARNATFSPAGNQVAYVLNNNLYVFNIDQQSRTAVTQDGKWNAIINGAADWVYEEEFAMTEAFAWSPDGTKIAYLKFDETDVPEYGMDLYGSLYPDRVTFKYPKAGEKNSIVDVWVYDIAAKENVGVALSSIPNQAHYIPRIKWQPESANLMVFTMPRLQNELNILKYNFDNLKNFQVSTLFHESSKTYVDITDNFFFLNKNKGIILTSEQNGFQHIYHIDNDGRLINQITKGEWEITSIYGIDNENNIYFSATENTIGQGIYRVNLKGTKFEPWMGGNYKGGYYDASFSKGMNYFILTHTDANSPAQITLHNSKSEWVRSLVKNQNLQKQLTEYNCVKKEFFQFQSPNGTKLNGWMMRPNGAQTSGEKYPVLLTIYGGPGRNTVVDQFEGRTYLWHQLLVQKGFVVVSVDPRGTQFRGRDFKHATYMQLGKLETEDFIETAKFLQGFEFVDKDKINIQGWSFGGYMTSLCMTKGADVFHAGIAVAPVTNWKYYDSIYTERFLRTPQENKAGYEENSPVNFAKEMKGPFLLIHGSADDNVHYQNSMDFAEALIQQNKKFDFFSYPNKNHGISGGKTRLHLFQKMTDFLMENR
jgi:dipeptidyl-peptidase-4